MRRDKQSVLAGWLKKRYLNLRLTSASSVLTFSVLLLFSGFSGQSQAQKSVSWQDGSPFAVSNPKNQKWSQVEADRIYDSACALVARSVRPERPPHLHPAFVLVLGASDNEVIRDGAVAEVHLKTWNSAKFAEAVVIMAARDVLHADDLASIARQSVASAQSTISLDELKANR